MFYYVPIRRNEAAAIRSVRIAAKPFSLNEGSELFTSLETATHECREDTAFTHFLVVSFPLDIGTDPDDGSLFLMKDTSIAPKEPIQILEIAR